MPRLQTPTTRFVVLTATGILAAVLATPAMPAAAQGRADWLVSADALAERLDDPELVLLHVGRADDYRAEHIPGARRLSLAAISAPEDRDAGVGLDLQMPDPEALADTLEALGVSDSSRIVVYPGTDWVSASARVLLTLDWIGLGDRAALLDGGMRRWKAAGHPVTDRPPPPARRGSVTTRVREELVVSAEWVMERLDSEAHAIVDARAPVHYDGIQATYLHREPVRKGHIPGAANVPFEELWDDDLMLKPADELAAIFEAAGVRPGQTVVGYCHLGQFATGMLLAARTLGYPVALYDGSFQEWGSRQDLPVENPGRP